MNLASQGNSLGDKMLVVVTRIKASAQSAAASTASSTQSSAIIGKGRSSRQ
jgi:hypothetical protein